MLREVIFHNPVKSPMKIKRKSKARRYRVTRNPVKRAAPRRASKARVAVRRTKHHSAAMRAKIGRAVKAAMAARRRSGGTSVVRYSAPRSVSISRRRRPAGGALAMVGAGTPVGTLRSMLSQPVILTAAGAVSAGVATSWIINNYGANLPGITNQFGRVFYRLAIPALLAWSVRRFNKNFSDGLIIGGVVMGINSLMQNFQIGGAAAPQAVSEYPASPASPIRSFGEYLDPVGASIHDSESAFPASAW